MIQQRRIAHDGSALLRQHIQAADRKLDDDGKRLRIVKRDENSPVDLAICLSMAAAQCLYLQLPKKGSPRRRGET
jgi:hypothetical protein